MKKAKSHSDRKYKHIPTQLTESQFNEFILPHLSTPRRGPPCKVPLYRVFNYILTVLHTGTQWMNLPIRTREDGKPEICYTRVFRIYQRWASDGSLECAFSNTVVLLKKTAY
jgi:hypothetical protein